MFGSKYKTRVDNAVMPMVDEALIPNLLLEGGVKSIVDETRLMQEVMQTVMNSTGRKIERMYRWAKNSGEYPMGTPDVRMSHSYEGQDTVRSVVRSLVHPGAELEYFQFRPLNNVHLAMQHLIEGMAYGPDTNEIGSLSAAEGYPVYLRGIVPTIHLPAPEPGDEEVPELTEAAVMLFESPAFANPSSEWPIFENPAMRELAQGIEYKVGTDLTEGAEIHFSWRIPEERDPETHELVTEAELKTDHIWVSFAAFNHAEQYFQAKYTYPSSEGDKVGYFTYRPGAGTFADLDEVYALGVEGSLQGDFFPIAMFRRRAVNISHPSQSHTAEHIATTKLLEFLGIDFTEMGEEVHNHEDADNLQQALIMFGVPITAESQEEIEYLHRFFKKMYGLAPENARGRKSLLDPFHRTKYIKNLRLASSHFAFEVYEDGFSMILSFEGIDVRVTTGDIGPVGTYTNEVQVGTEVYGNADEPPKFGGLNTFTLNRRMRIIRHQIYPGIVEEVVLLNPMNQYSNILRGRGVARDIDADELLIPLDYTICRQMSLLRRDPLYFRSMHFIANTGVRWKEKWYQRGIFKAVVLVVAIVITIWTGYGASMWQAFSAALAAGAGAVAMLFIKTIAISMAMQFGFKVVAEELGPEWAGIIAIAALVAGGIKGFQTGFGKGTWATNLMQIGTGLADAASTEMGKRIQSVYEELEDLMELQTSMWEELEEIREDLNTTALIDPMVLVARRPATIYGESYDHFYQRTIHEPNPGVRCFEILENYVDISLRLPTLHDSVGDTLYA